MTKTRKKCKHDKSKNRTPVFLYKKQGSCEVDIVATRTNERLYIQICSILTEDNTQREFSPLEAIKDNYEKIVVSTDSLMSFNRNGIRQRNIIEFLLDA
ncbi:MAG: hypothetical protein RBR15_10135 [Sphaerochaeta sp.]|nr:hypothetical protein [Sphaerochaeta sp.]